MIFRSKRGIGIVEVLVSAAVLGFLFTSLLQLQKTNRESLLKIRSRDGATMVAQEIIDSLNALGVSSLKYEEGQDVIVLKRSREWKSQPGLIEHDIHVDYDVKVTLETDSLYMRKEKTAYLDDSVSHVYAKGVNVNVGWIFKGTPFSITVSGVVR